MQLVCQGARPASDDPMGKANTRANPLPGKRIDAWFQRSSTGWRHDRLPSASYIPVGRPPSGFRWVGFARRSTVENASPVVRTPKDHPRPTDSASGPNQSGLGVCGLRGLTPVTVRTGHGTSRAERPERGAVSLVTAWRRTGLRRCPVPFGHRFPFGSGPEARGGRLRGRRG